ncbi:MAG: hypothetical protein JWL59_2017 [Chthoniobacteraceae bacterium]|nr:hypothetical protein [Chthoniobacteraceae bacterium]
MNQPVNKGCRDRLNGGDKGGRLLPTFRCFNQSSGLNEAG